MKPVMIEKSVIHQIIAEAKMEGEAVVNLHKEIYPEWDRIEKVDGFPTCSREASDMIARWIHARHREMKGKGEGFSNFPCGVWMNNGWSSMEGDKCSDTDDCFMVFPAQVHYKAPEGEGRK